MRNLIRKIAFVGSVDRSVGESLREHGYRLEGMSGESLVQLTAELYRLRPAVVHARESHLKAALVSKLLDIPILLQVSRGDLGSLTARDRKSVV